MVMNAPPSNTIPVFTLVTILYSIYFPIIIFILKLWIVNKIYVNINIKIIKINIYVYDFIWIG